MSARNTFAATRRSHAILKWLQNGEGVTIQRVIDNFGIKYPQAREDLKLLEELYELSTHRDGRVKVWTWPGFDPDYVSVATAAALELGAIAMDLFDETPYRDEIERLADHCRSRVGDTQSERLDRVARALHLRRTWLPKDPRKLSEVVEEILDAIFHDRHVAMTYERADGEVRHYVTQPRHIVWYHGRLWLLADHKGETKLFDAAGIEELEYAEDGDGERELAKQDVRREEGVEPVEEYFADAFGIYAANYPVEDIRISVSNSWENYFRRYRIHPSQENQEIDGELQVRFHMRVCPEFKSFLLGMMPYVEVHEPTELRDELEERVGVWLESV